MVLGGNAPFYGAQNRAPGETRRLRYDTERNNMANVLFPGEQLAVPQPITNGHRNVTSANHPFLPTAAGYDAPATGRRAVRGRPDTNDMLAGPVEDAPAQRNVGMSAARARDAQLGAHPAASPEAKPVAGRTTRREDSMGSVLFGGALVQPLSMPAGKRRGPVDYSSFQLRAPRAAPDDARAAGAAAARQHDALRYGLAAPAERAAASGYRAASLPAPPHAAPPPDALDDMMRNAHLAELRAKWLALGAEVAAVPRDSDGMIGDISKVADALRKQGLLMSVAGFSELLARCDIEPSGFPDFDAFLDCLFREDETPQSHATRAESGPPSARDAPYDAPPRAQPQPLQSHEAGGGGARFHMPDYAHDALLAHAAHAHGGAHGGGGAHAPPPGADFARMGGDVWADAARCAPPDSRPDSEAVWGMRRPDSKAPTPRESGQPPLQHVPPQYARAPAQPQPPGRFDARSGGGPSGAHSWQQPQPQQQQQQLTSATEAALAKYAQRGVPPPPQRPVPVHEAAAADARRAVESTLGGRLEATRLSGGGGGDGGALAGHGQLHSQTGAHDGDAHMRRVPGSRAPLESKSAAWATSGSAYGRYGSVLPREALNSHVGHNGKPAAFTRAEPKREANAGFAF